MNPLKALSEGANATWFLPQTDPQTARKQWISAMKAKGAIAIDQGAATALLSGKSLLPAGITAVTGAFERGDPVEIRDDQGHVIGQGLVRYSQTEAKLITGAQTGEIAAILGYPSRAALIHRDDMAV